VVESVVEVVGDVPGLGGSASPYLVDGSLLSAEMGSGAEAVLVVGIENDHPLPGTLLLMSHPNRGFLAPKRVTHHFWEIHICGAAPLSINAILPICEGLVAARMTLCAVVNTSHPHIPETHQESRMKAFVG